MLSFKILPFLPFLALGIVYFLNRFPKFEKIKNIISSSFAILFLINLIDLRRVRRIDLNLLEIIGDFEIAFSFGKHQLFFCFLLGIFWFLHSLYSARYFALTNEKKSSEFEILFLSIIGFLSCIIFSKNLLSSALFYQLLAISVYFVLELFSSEKSQKSIKNFGIFIIVSASIMFLNSPLTFVASGSNEFSGSGIFVVSQISVWQFSYLLFFYFLALFAFAVLPLYFLFRNLYYLNPPTIIAGLIGFSLGILILLHKIIFYIFDMKLFAHFMEQINSSEILTIIIAANLLALIILALRSENLKQILVLLFFNQLILTIMSLLIIGLNFRKAQILIASFIFSQMLIFMALGNISLYAKQSKIKSLNGIFYKLRVTIFSLIFAFLNLSGLMISAGMDEKYWLFRDIISNGSVLKGLVLFANIALLLICATKIIFPMLEIKKEKTAKNYDGIIFEKDLRLILPALILPLILFSLFFFFVQRFLI